MFSSLLCCEAEETPAPEASEPSKRTSVMDIGVGIPGVGAFDISKARVGLKKTQPQGEADVHAQTWVNLCTLTHSFTHSCSWHF